VGPVSDRKTSRRVSKLFDHGLVAVAVAVNAHVHDFRDTP
jgi:hypothetical protein